MLLEAFWPGQSDKVWEYVQLCCMCQKVKAKHCRLHCLLHPLLLPTRRGWTLGVDWICGLPVTSAGFNQIMVIVDLLSGKVHATPSKSCGLPVTAAGFYQLMVIVDQLSGKVHTTLSKLTDNAATAAQMLLDHSLW